MPTHILPRGSEIIEALARLGVALGYVAESEFDVEQDRANPPAVDVAWLQEEGQRFPLMIFEVESQATNSAANNPVKVFGQSIEHFEKPLFFFHVFITAGEESTRIDNLRRVFGTHNYRVYRLDRDGLEPLVRDVLSQHRRLQRTLPIRALLDELTREPWDEVPISTTVEIAESLKFEAPFLNEYACRARVDIRFRLEHLRLLRAWLEPPRVERPTGGYETLIGDMWPTPVHLGLLALADTSGGDWLERLRDWQEHSSYMSRIGPHLGLSRDYDDFVLGLSPILWALTAALMYKVRGAATYIVSQVAVVLNQLGRTRPEASFFTAIWALHLASAADDVSGTWQRSNSLMSEVASLLMYSMNLRAWCLSSSPTKSGQLPSGLSARTSPRWPSSGASYLLTTAAHLTWRQTSFGWLTTFSLTTGACMNGRRLSLCFCTRVMAVCPPDPLFSSRGN